MTSFLFRKVRQHFADPAYFAEQFRRARAMPLASDQRQADTLPDQPRPKNFIEKSLDNLIVAGLAFVVGSIIVVLTWHVPAHPPLWIDLLARLAACAAVFGYSAGFANLADRVRVSPILIVALLTATLLSIFVFAAFHWTQAPSSGLTLASGWILLEAVINVVRRRFRSRMED